MFISCRLEPHGLTQPCACLKLCVLTSDTWTFAPSARLDRMLLHALIYSMSLWWLKKGREGVMFYLEGVDNVSTRQNKVAAFMLHQAS